MSMTMPKRPAEFELVPPDAHSPEGWLSLLDSHPSIFPTWPLSRRMTLVVVVAGPDAASRAFVILKPQDVDTFIREQRQEDTPPLFFCVLKSAILPFVEGLTLESWQE